MFEYILRCLDIFQILIVLPSDPLASLFGDINSTDLTQSLCQVNVRIHSPLSIFQILIVLSLDLLASLFGDINSTDNTQPLSPVNVRIHSPLSRYIPDFNRVTI